MNSIRLSFLHDLLLEFESKYNDFIGRIPPDPDPKKREKYKKITEDLSKKWSNIMKTSVDIQSQVVPVEMLQIKYPDMFGDGLIKLWQYWKDHLAEKGIFMKSRYETESLKRLVELTGGDAEKASLMIKKAIAINSNIFYKWHLVVDDEKKNANHLTIENNEFKEY